MAVSFAVAPHGAEPVALGIYSSAVSPRNILADACPPQYRNAGVIRGTSFSKEDILYETKFIRKPHKAGSTSRLSRLSKVFTRKKSTAEEDPESSLTTFEPSPRLEVEIPAMKGFGSSLLTNPDGSSAVEWDDTETAPSTTVTSTAKQLVPIRTTPNLPPPAEELVLVKNVIPTPNGFFNTVTSAYNQHHALILRPDDVWIAILTQFNFYVNANAELLRANFVAHDGKKELTVITDVFDDFGRLAREMVGLIEKEVIDPTLRAWVLPDFSTTTSNDVTVASIVLMATLKAYFEYVFCDVCCGIPRVTLEGEKQDWEKLLARAEKLKEYGLETIAWYHLLVPVLSRFVKAFDDPNGKNNIEFWQKVAHFTPGGSGPPYYSGWITAFCVFNDRGKWIGPHLKTEVESSISPESLTASQFWAAYGGYKHGLKLDGSYYHEVDADNIPPSYAEVDVQLVSMNTGETTSCCMTAGVVGTRVSSSGDTKLSRSGENDTVRPVIGWWLFNKKKQESSS